MGQGHLNILGYFLYSSFHQIFAGRKLSSMTKSTKLEAFSLDRGPGGRRRDEVASLVIVSAVMAHLSAPQTLSENKKRC